MKTHSEHPSRNEQTFLALVCLTVLFVIVFFFVAGFCLARKIYSTPDALDTIKSETVQLAKH